MDIEKPAPWEMCGWTWELSYQLFDGAEILEAPHCPRGAMSAEISCSPLATAQPTFGALSEVLGFWLLFKSDKTDIAHGVQLWVLWMLGLHVGGCAWRLFDI